MQNFSAIKKQALSDTGRKKVLKVIQVILEELKIKSLSHIFPIASQMGTHKQTICVKHFPFTTFFFPKITSH